MPIFIHNLFKTFLLSMKFIQHHQRNLRFLASLLLLLFSSFAVYAQQDSVKLFAHRGGAHEFDENTLFAFESAYANGLRGFETDVRVSKDHKLVIFHDASLKRIFDIEGSIEMLTSNELKKLRTKKGHALLFLDEFLDFFKDKDQVYIELEMKTNAPIYEAVQLKAYCDDLYLKAMAARPSGSNYVFTSFDKRPLQYLKQTYPEVDLLFIKSTGLNDELIAELQVLGISRVGCRLGGTTREMVQKAQKLGIRVSCWPGHSVPDFMLGVALGCDYLCSDIPVEVSTWVKTSMPWVTLL